MSRRIDFDSKKVSEAFRAGNRARKKESAQDAVESVDNVQAQINLFKEQTGKDLEIRDGHPYFDGDLWLKGCTRLTSLPDGLKVGENLYLRGCTGLTSLPAGLEVGGYLDLGGCTGLTSLPYGLKVGENLYLRDCTGLTGLSGDLEVGGDLKLIGCTGLTRLPDGLKVGGGLWLQRCTGLTSLPDGLKVGENLYLQGCTGLTRLPDVLEVGRVLNLEGCARLTCLPDGLKVRDDLYLIGCTGLTSLPNGLEVGGNLDLRGCTGLTSLPNGLEVGGNLDLRGCTGLAGLPFDLVVQGYIIHEGMLKPFFRKLGIRVDRDGDTKAEDWRRWQKARGYLTEAFKAGNKARKKESAADTAEGVDIMEAEIRRFEKETGLKLEVRDGRPYYKGYLSIECSTMPVFLPQNLEVSNSLSLEYSTGLESLPAGLTVHGSMFLSGCRNLKSLPPRLFIDDNLFLTDCIKLTSLPADLSFKNPGNISHVPGSLTSFFRSKAHIYVEAGGDVDTGIWMERRRHINEAFKVGNRARKKEAAQDTVGTFDGLLITPDKVRDYIGTDILSIDKMCTNSSWRELINRLLSEVFEKPHSKVDTYVKHENGINISTYYYTGRESYILVSGNNGYVMRLKVDGEGHPDKFTVGITFYDRGVRCLRGRGGDKEYETVLERDNCRGDNGYEFNDEGLLMFCQFLSTGIVPAGFAVKDVVLDEAFRAGNKARKKEAMQDAAAVTDSVNLSFMDTIGEIESFLCRRGEQEDRVMTAEGDAIDSGKWFDWRGRTEDYQALVIEVKNIDGDTCDVYVYVDATGVPSTFDATGQNRMDCQCTRSLSNRAVLNNVLSIFDRLAGPAGEDELPEDLREGDENWEIYKNLIRKHADFLQPFLCKEDLGRLIVDGVLDEAFKAGNRARRKESAQDTVESADRPVTFDETLDEIERLIHRIGSKYKRNHHNNLYSKQRPEAQAEIFHIHPFSHDKLTDNDVSRDGFYPGGWPEKVTHSYDAVVDLTYFPELDRTFVMMCSNVCTVDPGDIRRMNVFGSAGSYSEYYMGDYMDKDPLRDAGDYDLMGSEFFYPVDTVSDLGKILEVVTYMLTDRKWLACMALFTVCRSFSSQYTRGLLPGAICPYIRKDIRISPEMLHSAVNGALWNELLLKSHGLCGAIVDGRYTYQEILSMFEPADYRSEPEQPNVLLW